MLEYRPTACGLDLHTSRRLWTANGDGLSAGCPWNSFGSSLQALPCINQRSRALFPDSSRAGLSSIEPFFTQPDCSSHTSWIYGSVRSNITQYLTTQVSLHLSNHAQSHHHRRRGLPPSCLHLRRTEQATSSSQSRLPPARPP